MQTTFLLLLFNCSLNYFRSYIETSSILIEISEII
jgi:hypothetical protein